MARKRHRRARRLSNPRRRRGFRIGSLIMPVVVIGGAYFLYQYFGGTVPTFSIQGFETGISGLLPGGSSSAS